MLARPNEVPPSSVSRRTEGADAAIACDSDRIIDREAGVVGGRLVERGLVGVGRPVALDRLQRLDLRRQAPRR